MSKLRLCRFGVHSYVTKASWSRCEHCWQKPPKEKRLAPKRNIEGWRGGRPIR